MSRTTDVYEITWLALCMLLAPAAALAAGDTPAVSPAHVVHVVSIPWGDWLNAFLTATATFTVAVIGVVVQRYAPPTLKAILTNGVVAKAVDYALAIVEGATHGKTVDIKVSNELVAAAMTWVASNEPLVASWAGANLEPLIVARLSAVGVLPAEASAAQLGLR